jgi:conjugative relaxase-like TrwC/TraI family protein
MVATVSALSSTGQAASYYEADDYYAEGGLSPSEWFGAGADALGLKGEVDRDTFRSLLEGQVADGQLGTMRDGKIEHRPGWDVTFSAPKSVSVMALVAGDKRVIAAHAAAVKVALAHVEKHMAATRIRDGGEVAREATGNLAVATFRHETSRAQDPQLHSHAVILNATQDKDGTWRSLEPRALYQLQKQIGAIYRQELAHGVASLGYAIKRGKDSTFEIVGVPERVIDALSQRTAAIDARLAERGTSREQASAAEKQIAALDTRDARKHSDHRELRKEWRATADAQGFDQAAREALVAAARSTALSADQSTEASIAQGAVAFATAKLSEREAVFAEATLAREAGDQAFGRVSHAAIAGAIDVARESGALVRRTFLDKRGAEFAGFTTPQAIETERTMLRIEAAGRGVAIPLANRLTAASIVEREARASGRSGHRWTDDQKRATAELLSSRDRVAGVQGYAGTAKTTTVLATYAREATRHGYAVTAVAPTASAALVLGEALGTRGDTVARHLIAPPGAGSKAVWVVDEASMLSAHDMARLLTAAETSGARVVLVGDVKQLGSVGAGAAFAQLQSAGMPTAQLAEIVRQSNSLTREAVEASIEGDARKALAALDRGGGRLIEAADRDSRFAAIAKDYAARDADVRSKTLVIEPSRGGRDALTAEIRAALSKTGVLVGPAIEMSSLVAKSLTRAEARDPSSYERGDVVRFARDYADKGVARGTSYQVETIDEAKAAITLRGQDGEPIDWRLRQWGAGKSEAFEAQSLELKTGDRIQFTRNDREAGRINGLRGTVTGVNMLKRTTTVSLANGREQTLSLDTSRDQHIRHSYVETAFAAQGRTADHVMIHADSKATNLVDQKMLYVAVSRARSSAAIFTDDRAKLVSGIRERAGVAQTALDVVSREHVSVRASGIGLG